MSLTLLPAVDVRDGKRGEKLYVRESLHAESLAPAVGISRSPWGVRAYP